MTAFFLPKDHTLLCPIIFPLSLDIPAWAVRFQKKEKKRYVFPDTIERKA